MRVDRAVFIVCLANMRVERTETELEAFDHKNFFQSDDPPARSGDRSTILNYIFNWNKNTYRCLTTV